MVDQEIRVLGDENIIANPKNSQKQYPLTFKAVPNVIVYGRKKADLNFTVPITEGTNFNFNLERTAIIFSDSFNLEEYSYIMVKNPFEEISDFFYVSSLEELDPTGKEFNEFNDEVVKWLRRLVNIISNRCMIFETTLFKDLNNFPNIKTGQTFIRTEDGWTGITIRDINSELDLIFNKYVEEINKKIQEHQTQMNELLEQWKQDIQKYAENVKQYEIVRIVTQTGHGFVFEPVMYSISQRKFVKAVFPHGADGVAVRVDDNNFRLVWAGRVEIPATAKDTQQRNFVLGEYYFLGEGSNGGIQREKPDTYYQHLFQVMYSDELKQNIADVLLSVPINQKGKRWDVGEAKTTVNDIEELKMSDFPVGKVVEVLGYYKAGDGADHKRIIANEDDGSGVQLSNNLWACIVHNGEVNVSWFGAKGDGITDDTAIFKKIVQYNVKNINLENKKYICKEITINTGYYVFREGGFNGEFFLKKSVNNRFVKVTFEDFKGGLLSRTYFDNCYFVDCYLGYKGDLTQHFSVWNKFDRCDFNKSLTLHSENKSNGYCNANNFISCWLAQINISITYGANAYGMENISFVCCDLGASNGYVFEVSGVDNPPASYINTFCCYYDGKRRMTSDGNIKINDIGGMWVDCDANALAHTNNLSNIVLPLKHNSFLPITTKPLKNIGIITFPLAWTGVGPYLKTIAKFKNNKLTTQYSVLVKATTEFPKAVYGVFGADKDGKNIYTQYRQLFSSDRPMNSEYTVLVATIPSNLLDTIDTITVTFGIPNGQSGVSITVHEAYAFVGICTLPEEKEEPVAQLNTLYHMEKMKQENVYDDYISYMDEKTLYDKQQRKLEEQRQLAYEEALKENPELTYEEFMSVQPMTLNLVEEPQPSDALKKFMEKYL